MQMEIAEGGGDEELPKSFKGSLKTLNFGFALNLVFFINGTICLVEIVLQLLFSLISKNIIYFSACFLFGPLQLLGILLLICTNFYKSRVTRFRMATWATRLSTVAFIPFVNTVALNTIYVMSCYNKPEGGGEPRDNSLGEFEEDEYKYCGYVFYNAAILVLCIMCVILNLVFCIPFNVN